MNQTLISVSGVRGYIDQQGTAQLNLEDVAKGLGFSRVATSGNEVIRWERLRSYLHEYGVPTSGHGGKEGVPEYIPENIFYLLSMKANNSTAVSFQKMVANEILPSIRKHGAYMTSETIERTLSDPDFIIKVATELKKEKEKRIEAERKLLEAAPKLAYIDTILKSKGTVTTTQIAKDYGFTANELNDILHEQKIQYKVNDQWVLYRKYDDKGYTQSYAFEFKHKDGSPDVKMNTRWTQRGRLFIHELLQGLGIKANIDKEYNDAR